MPPRTRRSPVWSNGKVLDLISVCGDKAVQSQLHSSHRNYDTFRQISKDMMERSQDWDALQFRVKVKELRNAYRKAREANNHSSAAPATCRFYKELDTILGGDPISTPSTTMDTSEPSSTRQEEEEEEQSGSEGAEAEEDACSQELFSSQEEGSQSRQLVLGEGQTPEEFPRSQKLDVPYSPCALELPFPDCQLSSSPLLCGTAQLTMLIPLTSGAPAWRRQKVLDVLGLCGEEAGGARLWTSHRNVDIYEQIVWGPEAMLYESKGTSQRIPQARVANDRSGGVLQTCHVYNELRGILGGDPTSTLQTTMDA
ncbi:hypothetical protein UY3_01387 [Chelonia mydas]|uniref:Myb/SANT-like DNA-binding domain-containing protein n=1 Tax=Chelonia mydas TaxID=8469 RepID=M7BU72_CHEMY|nr:hypothetical protein UY3_01387 [Chelonia mydas]